MVALLIGHVPRPLLDRPWAVTAHHLYVLIEDEDIPSLGVSHKIPHILAQFVDGDDGYDDRLVPLIDALSVETRNVIDEVLRMVLTPDGIIAGGRVIPVNGGFWHTAHSHRGIGPCHPRRWILQGRRIPGAWDRHLWTRVLSGRLVLGRGPSLQCSRGSCSGEGGLPEYARAFSDSVAEITDRFSLLALRQYRMRMMPMNSTAGRGQNMIRLPSATPANHA